MSSIATDETAVLNEIERHVAWFYAAAIRAATETSTRSHRTSDERFIRRVLQTTEAFRTAVGWLHDVKPHPDQILDLAVILRRAVEHWDSASAAWTADPSSTALSAAAAELAESAETLEEVIAVAPWFGNNAAPDTALSEISPRKVQ